MNDKGSIESLHGARLEKDAKDFIVYIEGVFAKGVSGVVIADEMHDWVDSDEMDNLLVKIDILQRKGFIDTNDTDYLKKALGYAHLLHKGQERRFENKPYISHVLRVAIKFSDMLIQLDSSARDALRNNAKDALVACFLHDSVEDQAEKISGASGNREKALTAIQNKFGAAVRHNLNVLSKPDKVGLRKDENYQNWVTSIWESGDPVQVLIKFADIYDNIMSTVRIYEGKDSTRLFECDADDIELDAKVASWFKKYKRAIESLKGYLKDKSCQCAIHKNPAIKDLLQRECDNLIENMDEIVAP